MGRRLLVISLALLLVGAVQLAWRWYAAEQETRERDARLTALIDSLARAKPADSEGGGLSYELEELRRAGLRDPVAQLRDSLRAHPELIPYEGTLGGKMGFYFEQKITVLSPNYVFAYFEDGHIAGNMLLEYEVEPGPKITWRRLWARLD